MGKAGVHLAVPRPETVLSHNFTKEKQKVNLPQRLFAASFIFLDSGLSYKKENFYVEITVMIMH